MNESYRKGQRNINDRRWAAKGDTRKRLISTHVAQVVEDKAERKAVTAALQAKAKVLRESGALGKVQQRVCPVASDVRGKTYRYDRRQIACVAAAYKPRKAEYKAARAALLAA